MSEEIINNVALDGKPDIEFFRRAPIKLRTTPTIVIAVPCGNKDVHTKFLCNKELGGCGSEWLHAGQYTPQVVAVPFMLHFNDVQLPLNTNINYYFTSGRLSAEARQIMTKQAIRAGADYILYWDDDVLPPPMGLLTLHNFLQRNPKIGAVTGVYMSRTEPSEPLVYKEHGVGAYWDVPVGPNALPVPILGAGAGFLLARIEAIKDTIAALQEKNDGIELPIWADSKEYPEHRGDGYAHMWGHDLRFCKLLQEAGWPVYVDGRVVCGHYDLETGKTYTVQPTTSTTPSVEVIVVKYNQPELELQTVRVAAEQTQYPNVQITAITNPPGRSLAACWNEAIANSTADYICLLNSDTMPAKGWLEKLMEVFKLEPRAGAVVPSSNIVFLSQVDTTLERMENNIGRINAFAQTLPGESYQLPTLSAMCVVFPRKLWEEVGKFDERFMLYGEDTEFFWRLAKKTSKLLLWRKDAYVHHFKAQSVEKAVTEGMDIAAIRAESERLVNELTDLQITH